MITRSEFKYIQSLGHKKFRDEARLFVAEGPKIVSELIGSPHCRIKTLYGTGNWWNDRSELQNRLGPEVAIEIKEEELERMSFQAAPNQVLGVFYQADQAPVMDLEGKISLMLDSLQDPGNVGTIVRIADWFGVRNIIASPETADIYNPKVVQATMGSIARVQVTYQELPLFLEKHPGIPVYAAMLEGKSVATVGKVREGIVLIGNESKGIQPALLEAVSHKITIPRIGAAESLNAAVAAGIILSHLN